MEGAEKEEWVDERNCGREGRFRRKKGREGLQGRQEVRQEERQEERKE